MRPKRIIFIRHGESEGNADRDMYEVVPDYQINLTEKGKQQAREAAQEIKQLIGEESLHVYLSPYYRTRQTYESMREVLQENIVTAYEDPRLREQEWGHLRNREYIDDIIVDRENYSTFYFRIPDGESGADVYDRVSIFLETLHRDFDKPEYPENTLIVTHGMLMRLFLMRWFHWSVEEFEDLRNPFNCQVVVMQKNPQGKYDLVTTLRRRSDKKPKS